ncbi:aminoglycoside adenylyltransferase domain-containing protein [Micromonospora sp. L31]|uniref:aminoglycoside adenylyltransferase domain-containing protein n=1 Tax=Micromonospora sp. L31 TaxID=3452213 RepID=UPI003F8A6A1E
MTKFASTPSAGCPGPLFATAAVSTAAIDPPDIRCCSLIGVTPFVPVPDRALLDTRSVILTLARIRTTLATGGIRSKDAATGFVLDRLPAAHRWVLADDARAIYRGLAAETWDALRDRVRRYADHHVAEIERPAADP